MDDIQKPDDDFSFITYVPNVAVNFSQELYDLLSDAVGADVNIDVAMDSNSMVQQVVARYVNGNKNKIKASIKNVFKNYQPDFTAAALDKVDAAAMKHLAPLTGAGNVKNGVHTLKLEEARRVVADKGAVAPLLRAEADKTGQAIESIANAVILNAEKTSKTIAEIESDRISAKKAIREAKTREEAEAVVDSFTNRYSTGNRGT